MLQRKTVSTWLTIIYGFGWQTAHLCFGCHMQNSLSFVADLYFLIIPKQFCLLLFIYGCTWKNASTGVAITPSDCIRALFQQILSQAVFLLEMGLITGDAVWTASSGFWFGQICERAVGSVNYVFWQIFIFIFIF